MRIRLIVVMIFVSNGLLAQQVTEITQFEPLNHFLNVRDFCISSDGSEALFTLQSPGQELSQIATIRKANEVWLAPELMPFSDAYMDLEPFLSDDGLRLYFVSDRPLADSTRANKDFDIWYVDRERPDGEWSKPTNMGTPINTGLNEFYPSVSKYNNLYFTMEAPDGLGKDDIYFCQWEDGRYLPPVLVDGNINTPGYEFNAFIAKQEDFMLFSRYNEEDGQGSGDLYISKKASNGTWGKATNLGVPINTPYMEYCPFYDAANQLLYFTSKRNTITPKTFSSVAEFKKYVQESDNGLSKIYVTPMTIR